MNGVGYDSRTPHYREKVPADDPRYKALVAEPVMNAVDALPTEYRKLVHEFGYVEVYRRWLRNVPANLIRKALNG